MMMAKKEDGWMSEGIDGWMKIDGWIHLPSLLQNVGKKRKLFSSLLSILEGPSGVEMDSGNELVGGGDTWL